MNTSTPFTETQRSRRGHRFYPSATEANNIPALQSTGNVGVPRRDRTIYAHYFLGDCDWYLAEYDAPSGVAWGYACMNCPERAEWGLVYLPELEETSVRGQAVKRDRNWAPISAEKADMPGEPFRYPIPGDEALAFLDRLRARLQERRDMVGTDEPGRVPRHLSSVAELVAAVCAAGWTTRAMHLRRTGSVEVVELKELPGSAWPPDGVLAAGDLSWALDTTVAGPKLFDLR